MGWIIAGAVVVVIMILLMTSVKVRFEYSDGLRLRINWLFITLVQIPAGTRKQKRRNKKTEKAAESVAETEATDTEKLSEEAAEKSAESSAKSTESAVVAKKKESTPEKSAKKKSRVGLSDIWEIVKLVWDSLSKPLKRLLKATRIYSFRLRVVCGGDDAAKAALNYGRISAVAGVVRAFLEGNFTVVKPDFDISVDFMSEETTAECSFTAKLTPIAAVAFLFWVVGRAVRNYMQRDKAKIAIDKLRK